MGAHRSASAARSAALPADRADVAVAISLSLSPAASIPQPPLIAATATTATVTTNTPIVSRMRCLLRRHPRPGGARRSATSPGTSCKDFATSARDRSARGRIHALDARADGAQPLIDPLVATVDLLGVVY